MLPILIEEKIIAVTSLLKVPSKLTEINSDKPLTCSIGEASALLNVSDTELQLRYGRYLKLNKLHQLRMSSVLRVYDRLPKPRINYTQYSNL